MFEGDLALLERLWTKQEGEGKGKKERKKKVSPWKASYERGWVSGEKTRFPSLT